MKSSITRTVDEFGRISLPIGMRRALDINERDEVVVEAGEGCIIIKKSSKSCVFCGKLDNLTEFNGKCICATCKSKLK